MGQASDLLFEPVPKDQRTGADMGDTKGNTIGSNIPSEQPTVFASEAEDGPPSFRSSSPEHQLSNSQETEDVAKGAFSGLSIFQGLSHLLHSVLVLGALDARDRFQDASAQVQNQSDDIDAASEAPNQLASSDEQATNGVSTSGGISMAHVSEENANGGLSETGEIPWREVDTVALDGSISSEESGSQHDLYLPSKLQESVESTVSPDGTNTGQKPMNLQMPADQGIGTNNRPQPESVLAQASQGQSCQQIYDTQPLFQSFSRPSVSSIKQEADEAESIEFSDLRKATSTDEALNHGRGSSICSTHSSDAGSNDSGSSKPVRSRWLKTARKVITGQYHRKSPLHTALKKISKSTYKVSDPPIQTVTAARKPTIVQNFIRRTSHQPTVVEESEYDEDTSGETYYELDEDALAPFNKLEKEISQ
ncbi:MAG: hypothetical protein Q9225_006305 [Loekoesia sp. 1 TL-2023]